jgi:heme/copper-type cytochrome/quinol oxidase subunit 2
LTAQLLSATWRWSQLLTTTATTTRGWTRRGLFLTVVVGGGLLLFLLVAIVVVIFIVRGGSHPQKILPPTPLHGTNGFVLVVLVKLFVIVTIIIFFAVKWYVEIMCFEGGINGKREYVCFVCRIEMSAFCSPKV